MSEKLECTESLKKYLQKLKLIIKTNATFTLGNICLYEKNRIDDILCCIEGSFPDEYKQIIKNKQARGLKSYLYYHQLTIALKQRFFLSANLYKINTREINALTDGIMNIIDSDIKFIRNSSSSS